MAIETWLYNSIPVYRNSKNRLIFNFVLENEKVNINIRQTLILDLLLKKSKFIQDRENRTDITMSLDFAKYSNKQLSRYTKAMFTRSIKSFVRDRFFAFLMYTGNFFFAENFLSSKVCIKKQILLRYV